MGAGDGTRTRDIQLGRKDANAQAVRVFRKALDASMAHFLEPLLLSLSPPRGPLHGAQDIAAGRAETTPGGPRSTSTVRPRAGTL